MSDWTSGYVSNVIYTYGYYKELNPLSADLALLNAGIAPSSTGTHCELGFGLGLSVNIHAAASGNTWYGTDFNPSQAGFAQALVSASGADAHLFDESFAEFASRPDLPDFETIGLHGIWSWVSDDNRAVIVDFVRRKLKVGGVLYLSYNTQPGWADILPMRDLLTEHVAVMSAPGKGMVNQIDEALDFAERLMAVKPAFASANALVAEKLRKLRTQNRSYLAHEYFNRDWHPMPFSRMASWLSAAKLDYACSATYQEQIEALHLTPAQQALVREIPDPIFRETVRDFCVNQRFRRDYWVKGTRRLTANEQSEALREHRVILATPRYEVPMKVSGGVGEVTMQDTIYGPILDVLASQKPQTLKEIARDLAGKVSPRQILEGIIVLTALRAISPVQDETSTARALASCARFNAHVIDKARGGSDIDYLASPVTGGGIFVPRFSQLFLLARSKGMLRPTEWARFAWDTLAGQGESIVIDGRALPTPDENLAELSKQAATFAETQLPILQALGVCPA